MPNITKDTLKQSLINSDVRPGDVVFMHSDASFLAQLDLTPHTRKFEVFFNILADLIGPKGTLVLPAFTYSITKNEIFDPELTSSQMGQLSEYFRSLPGVRRSSDPIFSTVSRGFLANKFATADFSDSFGKKSFFSYLYKYDALILCLGCSLNKITFTHFVEQSNNVNYRFFKDFNGHISQNGNLQGIKVKYFARNLNSSRELDLSSFSKELAKKNMLMEGSIGRFPFYSVRAKNFFNEGINFLKINPMGFLR